MQKCQCHSIVSFGLVRFFVCLLVRWNECRPSLIISHVTSIKVDTKQMHSQRKMSSRLQPKPHRYTMMIIYMADRLASPLTILSLAFFFCMPLCCLPATYNEFLGQTPKKSGFHTTKTDLLFIRWALFFIDDLFFSQPQFIKWCEMSWFFLSEILFLFVWRLQGKLNANG